jgi:hypothetical protein
VNWILLTFGLCVFFTGQLIAQRHHCRESDDNGVASQFTPPLASTKAGGGEIGPRRVTSAAHSDSLKSCSVCAYAGRIRKGSGDKAERRPLFHDMRTGAGGQPGNARDRQRPGADGGRVSAAPRRGRLAADARAPDQVADPDRRGRAGVKRLQTTACSRSYRQPDTDAPVRLHGGSGSYSGCLGARGGPVGATGSGGTGRAFGAPPANLRCASLAAAVPGNSRTIS